MFGFSFVLHPSSTLLHCIWAFIFYRLYDRKEDAQQTYSVKLIDSSRSHHPDSAISSPHHPLHYRYPIRLHIPHTC